MAQVEFQFKGRSSIIHCKEDQRVYEICNNFISKLHLNENNLNFVYNGRGGPEFDKNLTFNQMANSVDKERKKMNILVLSDEDNLNNNNNNNLIRAKNIICPICLEDIKIKRINNYKIYFFECKNTHKINDILLDEFEKTQMINLMNIKCNICKNNNKYNTYNNEFYKCFECNVNICPLCKSKHNKEHCVINYDKLNYICNKHNELFTNYCNKCKINICSLCEKEHFKHCKKSIGDMIFDKEELINELNKLKQSINIFNDNFNEIMEVLNKVRENMKSFYKLEEYIIENYDKKERNYEILYNIDKIMNYNNIIINDINKINNEKNVKNKFDYINDIYFKFDGNELKLTLKIDKDDINKKIYFLDNTDDNDIYVKTEINEKLKDGLTIIKEEHHHDFLKELNDANTELYINDKKFKYEKYFIPEKEGDYNILLKFKINMNDCSFMFYKCSNITKIDLSSFDTQNVTDMRKMFFGCNNLKEIDLSTFNTQSVTNMFGMFGKCKNLNNINLSLFSTENVTDMSYMFDGASNLTNLDLSSFNTQNVKNMYSMFIDCSNLIDIDLSSFNTIKVKNMAFMFAECFNIKNINLSSFKTQNVTHMNWMFVRCSNLLNIDLSSFNVQNVINMSGILNDCSNLKEIKINKKSGEKIMNEIEGEEINIKFIE